MGQYVRVQQNWVKFLIAVGFLLISAPSKGLATAEIVINIPAFTLHLYQDGVPTATYPIGVGQVVKPSLLGETRIVNRVYHPTYYPPDWYVKGLEPIPPGPDNPVGTRWLGLGFQGYGIHGTNNPASIGTPASSGCIRMYNHHVEELAELVSVGTVVRFVYDTIQAWRDPVSGQPLLTVYADIYKQGTNTLAAALGELREIGATDDVHRWTLEAIIGEAKGTPRPVPLSVPLSIDGAQVGVSGVWYGGRLLLPLEPLAEMYDLTVAEYRHSNFGQVTVGGRVVPESFKIGSRSFAPVDHAAQSLGLLVDQATRERISLRSVRLLAADDGIGVRAFAADAWLLVPAERVAAAVGVSVKWDDDLEAVVVDGKPMFGASLIESRAYLPHDRLADALGVRIRWTKGDSVASLQIPSIRLTAAGRDHERADGFVYGEEVYVPVRMVTDLLSYTLGWNQSTQTAFVQGVPVKGIVRDGRVFAAVGELASVMPQLRAEWDPDLFYLTLHVGSHD